MRTASAHTERASVLVGVVKSRRDLALFLKEHWYRVPASHLPKRKPQYLALYQPAVFGAEGKCVRYYARVAKITRKKRVELFPEEAAHPRSRDEYARIETGRSVALKRPVRNTSPRRVSFAFTTLERLLAAKNMLQLYDVAETEMMLARALRKAGIKASPQFWVTDRKLRVRYRLDFAVFCKNGKLAIECDNKKAHSGGRAKSRDLAKDTFLAERGWTVVRFAETDITSDVALCVAKLRKTIREFG